MDDAGTGGFAGSYLLAAGNGWADGQLGSARTAKDRRSFQMPATETRLTEIWAAGVGLLLMGQQRPLVP